MNNKVKNFTFLLAYFAIFYIFQCASINMLLFPFAFSFAFALIWSGEKTWIVFPSFVGAMLLFGFDIQNLVSIGATIFFLLAPFVFNKIFKKKVKIWGMIICLILSKLSLIPFVYQDFLQLIYLLISTLIGVLFFLAVVKIIKSINSKGWVYKFTNLEFICLSICIIVFADGISTFSIGNFYFLKLFAPFLLLVISYCMRRSDCVFVSLLIAFGSVLPSGRTIFVAPILCWTLAIIIFKSTKKVFPAMSLVLAELICGYFFKFYTNFDIINMLSVIISACVFAFLPKMWIDKLKSLYETKNSRYALKSVYNEGKEVVGRRLEELSNVFFEMNLVFKNMLKKSLGEEDIKTLLYKEVKKRVCENCPEKARCHRTFCEDTTSSFDEIISISFKKGKVTLLDIPSFLNSRCNKVNLIISNVNSLCGQYKRYSEVMGTLDTSKLLLAEQLFGISGVIKNLAKDVSINVSFDTLREEKIKEELCFNNIVCSDAIVYDKDIHTKEVSLMIRNEDEANFSIPKIVSSVCENKMLIASRNTSITPGWTNLILKNAPKYDCVFGLALQTKTGSKSSGDSHSEIRLNENKFLFALCDGMGSGEKANATSSLAIALIENFYKAGFDNETILSSVNKLLILQKEETFSALDVCVLDLNNGLIDIIKMGSPSSFIYSKKEIKIIEGGALPLGIVGEENPLIKKYIIDENEFVILMSDGISDSYASDKQLSDFISRIKSINPQEIADSILQKALENNNGRAIDDMSVLVIKIFKC